MKDIRVIIVEDELHNSRLLEGMLASMRPHWKLEAVLESVEESVAWYKSHKAPDLILLDIQLSDGLGFSFLSQIDMGPETHVIFTTAYDQYAIRAFKVNSVDYLLKPIKEEELEQAFKKFESRIGQSSPLQRDFIDNREYYQKVIKAIVEGKREYRTRFLISGIKDYTKLETKDIAYFYSSNKATFAVCYDKSEHLLDYTLEQLEGELNPQLFYRLNRQIITHVDAVIKVSNASGNKLTVKMEPQPDFEVSVSRLKASDFKKWLGK